MSVRVLFVEDSQDDVELQLRRLREAGMEPHWDRVQTEDGLKQALADESWQVALVDYNIPGFSGIGALRLIAELAPDLPAVTVSGAIDEDTAVATMSAGAVDYVLKDNLTRLAPAVRRAIDGAEMRRAHRQAAEAARLALFAVDNASLAVTMVARDGTVVYVNDHACRTLRGRARRLVGSDDLGSRRADAARGLGGDLGPCGRLRARSSSAWTGGSPTAAASSWTSRPTTSRPPTCSSATAATSRAVSRLRRRSAPSRPTWRRSSRRLPSRCSSVMRARTWCA